MTFYKGTFKYFDFIKTFAIYVPRECKAQPGSDHRYYQYTMIEKPVVNASFIPI